MFSSYKHDRATRVKKYKALIIFRSMMITYLGQIFTSTKFIYQEREREINLLKTHQYQNTEPLLHVPQFTK